MGVKADGSPCNAYAIRGVEPPRCYVHSMTPEELSEQARKMAIKSSFVRRADASPRVLNGMAERWDFERIVTLAAPALEATLEYPPGAPDWSARLSAAFVIVTAMPRTMRRSPEDVRELLERALPRSTSDRDELLERVQAGEMYKAMRAEWVKLPRWSSVRGLFVPPFPPELIAPWEDRETVEREELPPDDNSGEGIVHSIDGRVIRLRPGELPLVLERSR